MITEGDPLLDGICVYGAAQPINDVYGDESVQGNDPACFFQGTLVGTATVVTEKTKDKDLARLFTAIDWFYSEEGSIMRSMGFSDEQQAVIQSPHYVERGYEKGAYTVETDNEGNKIMYCLPEKMMGKARKGSALFLA